MPNGNDTKDKDAQTQKETEGRKLTTTSRYEPTTSRDRITSDHSQYLATHKFHKWTERPSTGAGRGRGGKS